MLVMAVVVTISITSDMANAQLDYKFIPTSRGGRYLVVNEYLFIVSKRKKGECVSWKCVEKDCTSRASTISDIISKCPGDHNHQPAPNKIKV